jgi:hypothetical protein
MKMAPFRAERPPFIKRSERKAMWEALDGNPSMLANHLRWSIASTEELALAANLLEGKVKPRRPKSGGPRRMQKDQIGFWVLCQKAIYPDRKEMAIIKDAADIFKVSERLARSAASEFDPERGKKILRMLADPETAFDFACLFDGSLARK